MIQRIVKLRFKPEYSNEFSAYFKAIKSRIESNEGCIKVKLLRDVSDEHTFFTYSFWENEAALNTYRKSDLFGEVWPKVKQWFSDKPKAWSVEEIA